MPSRAHAVPNDCVDKGGKFTPWTIPNGSAAPVPNGSHRPAESAFLADREIGASSATDETLHNVQRRRIFHCKAATQRPGG